MKSTPIILLQLLGVALVALGLARIAFAGDQGCRPSVSWHSGQAKPYVVLDANNKPVCMTDSCTTPVCEAKLTIDGFVCRCGNGLLVPDACELVVTFTSDQSFQQGGSTCRFVTVQCNPHCNVGGCTVWDSESGSCWSTGVAHGGSAVCPPCQ